MIGDKSTKSQEAGDSAGKHVVFDIVYFAEPPPYPGINMHFRPN
jgi:hypothetical protein